MQKCSKKLRSLHPRIKILNLTLDEVVNEKAKVKSMFSKSLPKHYTRTNQESNMKEEMDAYPTLPPLSKDEDISENGDWHDFGDSDHSTAHNHDEDNTATGTNQPSQVPFPPKPAEKSGGSVAIRKKCTIDPKTNTHTCKDCLREFTSYPAFYSHYKSEHLKIQYTCSACGRKFNQIGNYNKHKKQFHQGVKFKCQLCNQVFTLESSLQKHRENDTCSARETIEKSTLLIIRPPKQAGKIQSFSSYNPITGKYKCSLCSAELGSKDSFRQHYNSVHLKVRYKCTLCEKDFINRHAYNKHHESVHIG